MKAINYLLIPVCLIMAASCGNNNKKAPVKKGDPTSRLKPGRHCYLAVYEKDTAFLKLDIKATGKVSGDLVVKYFNTDTVAINRQSTYGQFTGEFMGDTVRADYRFASGPKGKTIYTNPVALLHRGDTLIMGYGRVYEYLGRNYFDPATPIGYAKSKFRFLPHDCR